MRLCSTNGIECIGYCNAVNVSGRLLALAVIDLLAPLLISRQSLLVEGLWNDMYQEALLQGRVGAVMRALSAIDIAFRDLNAQSVGLPLHQSPGGFREDRIPAYASGGHYSPGKTDADLAEEVRASTTQGNDAVKIKVGRLSPVEEARRRRLAREAVRLDVKLTLNANNAWRDLPTALGYLRRFEEFDPYWIEEPSLREDIDNHARLAAATPIQVATGEIEAVQPIRDQVSGHRPALGNGGMTAALLADA